MLIYSQINAAWRNHVLGYGGVPGTIGAYGCYLTVCAMIAKACGFNYTPPTLDALATAKKVYVRDPSGTYDFLPDNALDKLFPGRFKTVAYAGFRKDLVDAAIPSKNSFAYLHIVGYSPLWRMNIATHYVLCWSKGPNFLIADPQGGAVRNLAASYQLGSVVKTHIVTYIPPVPPVVVLPPPAVVVPPVVIPPVVVVPPSPDPIPPAPVPQPTPLPDPAMDFWRALYEFIVQLIRKGPATP